MLQEQQLSSNPILRVENLSVDYRSREKKIVHALRNLSLSVSEGEILGVVGESGSGKTTLALAVSNLLRKKETRFPTGAIDFLGTDMIRAKLKKINRLRGTQIFMIFQDPFLSLNPLMKVKDQIAEAIKVRSKRTGESLSRSRAEGEVIEYLRAVRIADAYDVARRYPHQLSGGQNQRIMLAMALAEKPRLLIADEPTTALDVTTQAQVLGLLKEIVDRTKMSVLFITHDLAVAGSICDRIAVLYGGMLQEIGPSSSVLRTPKHPYTVGLIESVPSRTKKEGELEAIRGYFTSEGIDGICAFAPRCPYSRPACRAGVPSLIRVGENEVRCINYGEKYDTSAVGVNTSRKVSS